jgi:hypothetical protein
MAFATVAILPLAAAQDAPRDAAKVKVPVNLRRVKAGDWSVYLRKETVDRTTKPATVVEWSADAADGKTLAVRMGDRTKKVATMDADSVAAYFDLGSGATVTGYSAHDTHRTLGDHEVACGRVAFIAHDGGRDISYVAWITNEVRGWGVLALRIEGEHVSYDFEGDATRSRFVEEWELAGFGTKGDTAWGKTAEALRAELSKK